MKVAPITVNFDALEAMAAAGATPEMLIAVLRRQQDAAEKVASERRHQDKMRKRNSAVSVGIDGKSGIPTETPDEAQPVAQGGGESAKVMRCVLNDTKLDTLSSSSEDLFGGSKRSEDARARERKLRAEFDEWYAGYPHKVDKPAAIRGFKKARSKGVPLETLITGRDRYIREKPAEQAWCNPATWLNGERWGDQPATVAARPPPRAAPTNGAASRLAKSLGLGGAFHVQQTPNDQPEFKIIDGDYAPSNGHATGA